jgi:hypothetical protein
MYGIIERVNNYFNELRNPVNKINEVNTCFCRCVKKEPTNNKEQTKKDISPIQTVSEIVEEVEEVKPPPKEFPVVDMVFVE